MPRNLLITIAETVRWIFGRDNQVEQLRQFFSSKLLADFLAGALR